MEFTNNTNLEKLMNKTIADAVRADMADILNDSVAPSIKNIVADSLSETIGNVRADMVSASVFSKIVGRIYGEVGDSVRRLINRAFYKKTKNFSYDCSSMKCAPDLVNDAVEDYLSINTDNEEVTETISAMLTDHVTATVNTIVVNGISDETQNIVRTQVSDILTDSITDIVFDGVMNTAYKVVTDSVTEMATSVNEKKKIKMENTNTQHTDALIETLTESVEAVIMENIDGITEALAPTVDNIVVDTIEKTVDSIDITDVADTVAHNFAVRIDEVVGEVIIKIVNRLFAKKHAELTYDYNTAVAAAAVAIVNDAVAQKMKSFVGGEDFGNMVANLVVSDVTETVNKIVVDSVADSMETVINTTVAHMVTDTVTKAVHDAVIKNAHDIIVDTYVNAMMANENN